MKVFPIKKFKYKKIKLDKKDKTILYLLTKNARLPLTKIAKLVQTKREVVGYRISKLRKNQIITGDITAIDTRKLGFLSFHIFLEIPDMSEENSERIIEKMKKNQNINVIITYSGKWNIEIGIFSKSSNEFRKILADIFSTFPVKDYQILMLADTIKANTLPKTFFKEIDINLNQLNQFKNDTSFHKDFLKKPSREIKQIDEKDKRILSMFSKDALIKINDIPKKIKIAKETAVSKIKNLIQNKIILDFRPVINYYQLGFTVQALLIKLSGTGYKNIEDIREFIKKNENTIWAVHTIGETDLLVYILTKDIEEFHSIVKLLRNQFPKEIEKFESLFAYEQHKYLFYPEKK